MLKEAEVAAELKVQEKEKEKEKVEEKGKKQDIDALEVRPFAKLTKENFATIINDKKRKVILFGHET
jgi:hypothetical protein